MNITDWVGKEELESKIVSAANLQLVLFGAKWCGYCSRFLEQARSYDAPNEYKLILVDADYPDESLWDIHKIRLVPTIIIFELGKELFRRDGRSGQGLLLGDLQEALMVLRDRSK